MPGRFTEQAHSLKRFGVYLNKSGADLLWLQFQESGARGRIRTCTGDVLKVVSLLLDYASKDNWNLPPVLPRRDFLTKEACGCRKEAVSKGESINSFFRDPE